MHQAISVARTLLERAGAELQDLTLHLLQQWSTLVIRSYERTVSHRKVVCVCGSVPMQQLPLGLLIVNNQVGENCRLGAHIM